MKTHEKFIIALTIVLIILLIIYIIFTLPANFFTYNETLSNETYIDIDMITIETLLIPLGTVLIIIGILSLSLYQVKEKHKKCI